MPNYHQLYTAKDGRAIRRGRLAGSQKTQRETRKETL
jgi:hypothetical protein